MSASCCEDDVETFTSITGIAAPLLLPNINTDAITPMIAGRSLSADIGKLLFANWRYRPDGSEVTDFVLNQPPYREAKVLIAGQNFGCGSSRERAVWALMRFGIRCVIAPSFADIFYDNAFQNGLLPLVLPATEHAALADAVTQAKEPVVTIDLEHCVLTGADGRTIAFTVPAERRLGLREGLEEIQVILRMEGDIDAFQDKDRAARPWIYLDR
jgi:3-isopropylmalate/(R)-2-methylmalate dehydratase small subunit